MSIGDFKITTPNQYVRHQLDAIVGNNCRFEDGKVLHEVATELARRYDEPEEIFPSPGRKPITGRQATLGAALLGLSELEKATYCDLVEKQDAESFRLDKSMPPLPHYHELLTQVNQLIEQAKRGQLKKTDKRSPSFAEARAIAEASAKAALTAERERAIAEQHPQEYEALLEARRAFAKMETYDYETARKFGWTLLKKLLLQAPQVANSPNKPRTIEEITGLPHTTFSHWQKKEAHEPNTLAHGNLVDRFTKHFSQEAWRDEVANYLLTIPWPERQKTGIALLDAGKKNSMDIRDLIRLDRMQKRMSSKEHAAAAGLTEDQISQHYPLGGKSRVSKPVMDQLATAMGCDTEATKARFRKVVLLLPHDHDQTALEQCFTPSSRIPVNRDATGIERGMAMTNFIRLLENVHGLRDRKELAEAIAAKNPAIESGHLQQVFHLMALPESDFGRKPENVTINHRLQKTTTPENAQAIAMFAFPKNPQLQAQCVDFFTNEKKYCVSHSAIAKRGWTNRRNHSAVPGRG